MPPDTIIVGIDVGSTSTGVAYSTLERILPRAIHWPGTDKIPKKVPTAVAYRAGRQNIASWGFECPSPSDVRRDTTVLENLKLYLTAGKPAQRDNFLDLPKYEDRERWLEDFLRALYQYVGEYIRQELDLYKWNSISVEYIFSVPATWNEQVVEKFRAVVRNAGFGEHEKHSVRMNMTEIEAVAVYAANDSEHYHRAREPLVEGSVMKEGDSLLVCDLGGYTTNLSVLKVASISKFRNRCGEEEELVSLEEVTTIKGVAVGSVHIDECFQREVEKRLELARRDDHSLQLGQDIAHDLTRTAFQLVKTSFGMAMPRDEEIKFRIKGMPEDYSHAEARIENGEIVFTHDDVRHMFDTQIGRIFILIEELRDLHDFGQVTYVVLTGGLSASQYVQGCISKRYGHNLNGEGKQILTSESPQLAVCKGLIIDRTLSVRYSEGILSEQRSPVSCGIVFQEPWSGINHRNRHAGQRKDSPEDGDFADKQIRWLIRRGQVIKPSEPITLTFHRVINAEARERGTKVWTDTIIFSSAPSNRLPCGIGKGDTRKVCELESKLDLNALSSGAEGVKKRKMGILGIKTRYYWAVKSTVTVHIGSAEMNFEIRFARDTIGGSIAVPVGYIYMSKSARRVQNQVNDCKGTKDVDSKKGTDTTRYRGLVDGMHEKAGPSALPERSINRPPQQDPQAASLVLQRVATSLPVGRPFPKSVKSDRSGIGPQWSNSLCYAWEIQEIIKDKLDIRQFLEYTLTLTAKEGYIEASPCRVHLQNSYGSIGLTLLDSIIAALESKDGVHECDTIFVKAGFDQALVRHTEQLPVLREALSWLCMAIRVPKGDGIFTSTEYRDAESGVMSLNHLSQLPEPNCQTNCWRALFKSAVVAVDSSAKLSQYYWLQLDFDVMTRLAAVEYAVKVGSGLVLLGYSTALTPIEGPVDGAIKWHFETCSHKSQLNVSELSAIRHSWFQTTDFELLRTHKAMLGWVSRAHVLLGTEELPCRVTWSSRQIQYNSWRWAGLNLQFLAQSVAPVQMGVQIGATYERVPNSVRFSPSDNYLRLLNDSSKEPMVLYDVSDRRSWLVPKLSVIHHMVLAYCKNSRELLRTGQLPFAQPLPDGGRASFMALSSKPGLIIEQNGQTSLTLRELIMGFSINLARTSLHPPSNSRIYGYEFMDIVCSKPYTELGKVSLNRGLSWAPLLRHIPCLFCANIGDVISGKRALIDNSSCNSLIKGHDFMAASMKCVDQMSQEQGNSNQGVERSFPGSYSWTLCGDPFSACQHGCNTAPNCWDDPSFLQEISRYHLRTNGNSQCSQPSPEGAVVFGGKQRKRYLFRRLRPRRSLTIQKSH